MNEPDSKQSSAATLAAAALAGDPVTPGYSPAGYSDYSPPGYSSRDSVWPTAPSPSRDARPATSGFPPASGESSRLAAGYVPVEPAAPASSSRSSSSIWTSQEPTSGKIGYSPSGGQRPDGIGLGTTAAPGATAASVAAGAAAAGIAASSQFPGRMVASKPPVPTSAPPQTDDLVSKLKAPFSTVTKKRKPAQPSRPINSANAGLATAGIAAAVKTKPAPTKRPAASVSPQAARQPGAESHRDAQLVVSRIEPWSVMKFSFITALAGWIVLFVAVALLYYALRAFGVFHYLEQSVATVTSSKGHAGEDASSWLSASTVLGYTMLVGAINVVMLTALATVGAVIYNLVTHVAGGVEVTLREAD